MGLIAGLMILIFIVGLSAFSGWMTMLVWNLAAVPLFHAPHATFIEAWALMVGIGMIGSCFRSSFSSKKEKD